MNKDLVEQEKRFEKIPSRSFSSAVDEVFNKYIDLAVIGSDDPFGPRSGEEDLELSRTINLPVSDAMTLNVFPEATEIHIIRPVPGIENSQILIGGYRLTVAQNIEGVSVQTSYTVDGNDVMKQVKEIGGTGTIEYVRGMGELHRQNLRKAESIGLMDAVERVMELRRMKGDPIQEGELQTLIDILKNATPVERIRS
jgi:hypothetical protein